MKTFTYSQKKWAMTGCLLLVLGFNLSVHNSTVRENSVDLASNEADIETKTSGFPTAKGRAKVRYVKQGDKVQAIVTEGDLCTDCGNTFEIEGNLSDIEALDIALLKIVEEKKQNKVSAITKKLADTKEDDVDDEKDEQKIANEKLAKIKTLCAPKRSTPSSRTSALNCYTDKLKAFYKNNASADIDRTELDSFMKKNVESLIRAQMQASRRIAAGARHGSDDSIGEGSEIRTETLAALEKLISWVPSEHEAVRQNLVRLETKILAEEALDTKSKFEMAERLKSSDPYTANILLSEALLKKQDLLALAEGMSSSTYYAMDRALRFGMGDESVLNKYMTDFNTYKQSVISGMQNPLSYTPGEFSIVDPNGNVVGRIANSSGTINQGNTLISNALTQNYTTLPSSSSSNGGVFMVGSNTTPTAEQRLAAEQARLRLQQNSMTNPNLNPMLGRSARRN